MKYISPFPYRAFLSPCPRRPYAEHTMLAPFICQPSNFSPTNNLPSMPKSLLILPKHVSAHQYPSQALIPYTQKCRANKPDNRSYVNRDKPTIIHQNQHSTSPHQIKTKQERTYTFLNEFTSASSATALVTGGNVLKNALLVPKIACWICDAGTPGRTFTRAFWASLRKRAPQMARLKAMPPSWAGGKISEMRKREGEEGFIYRS